MFMLPLDSNFVAAAVHDSALYLAVQRFSLNPGMS